jgi:Flp pilus assembly protein TadG
VEKMDMLARLRCERASALVEFTLVLPFLLLLTFGTVEIGRGFRTYLALNNAAREGARWLAAYPADAAGARAVAAAEAGRVGLIPAQLTITITPVKNPYQAGDDVTVRVACVYDLLFGAVNGLPALPMSGQATMRVLYG